MVGNRMCHFSVFRCIAYSYMSDQKRTKHDDKAEKCVFLSISNTSKAYKLYNLITKKVIISQDVVFVKQKFWPWGEKKNTKQMKQILVDFSDKINEPTAKKSGTIYN